jgi:hypothetical protein
MTDMGKGAKGMQRPWKTLSSLGTRVCLDLCYVLGNDERDSKIGATV